jgi:hypothetical protein
MIDIFKEGVHDLNVKGAKLNGKDIASFSIKLDTLPFTIEALQNYPSGKAIALFNNGSTLTDGALEILNTRAFMDDNKPDSQGFSIVRVPLPSFFTPNGTLREYHEKSEEHYYSKSSLEMLGEETEGIPMFGDAKAYLGNQLRTYGDSGGDQIKTDNPFLNEYGFLKKRTPDDLKKVYSEWGMPRTADDEQWYIAMKWPYKPNQEQDPLMQENIDGFYPLPKDIGRYGSAQDYKNRKVLVYSPATNYAVCLRPAYYLWGNNLEDLSLGTRLKVQFWTTFGQSGVCGSRQGK